MNEINANYAMPDNLRATSLSLSMEFATMCLQHLSFRFVPFIIMAMRSKAFGMSKAMLLRSPAVGKNLFSKEAGEYSSPPAPDCECQRTPLNLFCHISSDMATSSPSPSFKASSEAGVASSSVGLL